jgi:F-type H+-transporting ATPase subunit b
MLAFPPDFTFVIQLVSFFVLLVILERLLFTPFAQLLAERRTCTEGAREEAVRNHDAANELARTIERSLQEARAVAAAEAEAIRRQTREREAELFNQAKLEAAARLAQLRAGISRERDAAKEVLRQDARVLATSMADAVLRPAAAS